HAGGGVKQHRAEAEDVARRPGLQACGLLRRHETRNAGKHAGVWFLRGGEGGAVRSPPGGPAPSVSKGGKGSGPEAATAVATDGPDSTRPLAPAPGCPGGVY